MSTLVVMIAGLLAAGVSFLTNWLALIPWRRVRDQHWSEQARLLYPAMAAARGNLFSIPGILTLAVVLLWPDSAPLWAFTGIVSFASTYVSTISLDHEVFPRIPTRDLFRLAATGALLRLAVGFVFLGAAVLMPEDFAGVTWLIAAGVVAFFLLWAHGGMIWTGRKLGLIAPAPERLREITVDVSTRMHVSFREVLLIRSPIAQAFAIPSGRQLLFTERLLELLSGEEISAICAHELAHLTESRPAKWSRLITLFTLGPWIFFNPLTHLWGFIGFFGLLGCTLTVPRLYRAISRRLEHRADQMATANEGDPGTYARALAKLYADAYLPAVSPRRRSTHPHLYDRLLAAGVTPDFPRPAAAQAMSWNGRIFAGLLGILFALFAIRVMGIFPGTQ